MVIEKLEEIIAMLKEQSENSKKCETGNASAGRRLRRASMEAIKQLKELRVTVLEHTKK